MFKLITFRSAEAFWPLADRAEAANGSRLQSLWAAIVAAPRRLAAAILAELAARRAMQTLASLDARILRDIGIERDQIAHATRNGRGALLHANELPDHFARWS